MVLFQDKKSNVAIYGLLEFMHQINHYIAIWWEVEFPEIDHTKEKYPPHPARVIKVSLHLL